jgi:flagellar basal-body rod modification protein FlgD
MNALVNFRSNGLGNLSTTRKQKDAAMTDITSAYRAKLMSALKSAATANKASDPTANAAKTTETKATDTDTEETSALPTKELGRDAFLQLLVLELQNQDPLEPVKNSEMVAQLAQFSSLEQMEALNGSFDLLSGNVDQLNFISAQGLLGKYVEGMNEDGEVKTGFVDSVYLDGSIVVLNVDGEIIPMSGVLSVMSEAPEAKAEG